MPVRGYSRFSDRGICVVNEATGQQRLAGLTMPANQTPPIARSFPLSLLPMVDPTWLALAPVKFAAKTLRDRLTTSAESNAVSRAANAFAALANEPRWWRCEEPGWWSVQTIWIGNQCDAEVVEEFVGHPVRVLIEVVDHGECGVAAIEDWKPQPRVSPYSTRDRAFGHVLPGGGPVQVLARERPRFGRWEAA